MKRTIALLLSALLMLSALAGCGNKTGEKTPESQTNETTVPETAAPTGTTPAEPASETSPLDGSVIFEHDGVKVTTAGLDTDHTSLNNEAIIWLDVENSGDKDVYLGVSGGSVNDVATEMLLVSFEEENGEYIGASYLSGQTVPAGAGARYALGYYGTNVPGVDISTPGVMEVYFTLAEDEYSRYGYKSEPVIFTVDEKVPAPDVAALGTVVVDDDRMTLVVGDQDYDDFFGPQVYAYVRNKSDRFIGIFADSAELDGVTCDYLLGGLVAAPGKMAVAILSFDGEARELKGFENMTLNLSRYEREESESMDFENSTPLDPITVTYPPQNWGEYENAGCVFEVKPRINDLITVETPENDPDGVLFTVSETASREAGGHEGAGWLFSIGKVSADRLHEMLQGDMSGEYVFARDDSGDYFMIYHPTDVRYERATAEEMLRDQDQWTMLNRWREFDVESEFVADNEGLEGYYRGNTPVEIYLACAAWQEGVNATLSTAEFGPVKLAGVDGTPYAEFVMGSHFTEADPGETPDGEYVALSFPDDDVCLDFFFAPGGYVRCVSGGSETLYEAAWEDDNVSCAEAMQGWYYALCELAAVKPFDLSLERYYGPWYEKIAGRGVIDVAWCVAPGKVNVAVRWPESAAVVDTWEITARLEDGKLVYENGRWEKNEYDESGEKWYLDGSGEESGYFELSDVGELVWHDDNAERGGDSTFIK